jgi:hypothetical protein
MMMSIIRQSRSIAEMDHLAIIPLATTADDIEMISWAVMHGKPVLVGLEDMPAIIKLQEAGDDALSFAALYDNCLTLHEFERMKRHKVTSTDDLKLRLYKITLVAELDGVNARAQVLLKARNEIEAKKLLTEFSETEEFRRELTRRFVEYLFASDNVHVVSAGPLNRTSHGPTLQAAEKTRITPDFPLNRSHVMSIFGLYFAG